MMLMMIDSGIQITRKHSAIPKSVVNMFWITRRRLTFLRSVVQLPLIFHWPQMLITWPMSQEKHSIPRPQFGRHLQHYGQEQLTVLVVLHLPGLGLLVSGLQPALRLGRLVHL